MPEHIFKYFPLLTDLQKEKFLKLKDIYDRWNSMINVISRRDMDDFYIHHVLHSLSLAEINTFPPGTKIIDVGTGGGFPGIPLAIMFPECEFTLLDSIEKKIKVVNAVATELEIRNVFPTRKRIEEEKAKYHFIISRAVTAFPKFVNLTLKNLSQQNINNSFPNGLICLKGGNLAEELKDFRNKAIVYPINEFFIESYFETKFIVYLPA